MPTVSKLLTQSNESYQIISAEIFSSSSERRGFLGEHVLCRDVNKAIEYVIHSQSQSIPGQGLKHFPEAWPTPRPVYGILFVIQYLSETKFLHFWTLKYINFLF